MKEQKKLRIAMLGRIPPREGGIEIVVVELCTRMVEIGGHEVLKKLFNMKRSFRF